MFKVSQKTLELCVKYIQSQQLRTRMMFGASIVNSEYISHFILLLILLNSNKQMLVETENTSFRQ